MYIFKNCHKEIQLLIIVKQILTQICPIEFYYGNSPTSITIIWLSTSILYVLIRNESIAYDLFYEYKCKCNVEYKFIKWSVEVCNSELMRHFPVSFINAVLKITTVIKKTAKQIWNIRWFLRNPDHYIGFKQFQKV